MKQIFLSILLSTISFLYANELDKNLPPNIAAKVDEYTFIRRLYIDVAGRIPNKEEILNYTESNDANKKSKLIVSLLNSEDYVNNFYNVFADILRIRPEKLSDNIQLRAYSYVQYIRDFLKNDVSYDEFVKSLLNSEGSPMVNGATGYLLRDDGMSLDNLALSTKIFIGKDISCCQCHDDPFSEYTQQQFYELAAYMNNTNRKIVPEYREIMKRVNDEFGTSTELSSNSSKLTDLERLRLRQRYQNSARQLLSANTINVFTDKTRLLKYPFDYQYNNASPNSVVVPKTLDSKSAGEPDNRRKLFAEWVVQHEDFQNVIANRIFQNLTGINLYYPQNPTDVDTANAKNRLFIEYLGSYFRNNKYSIKRLIHHICDSDYYSRPAYNGSMDDFVFSGVAVRRMTSYQLWDSIMTMILDDPNYSKVDLSSYNDVVNIDFLTDRVDVSFLTTKIDKINLWEKELSDKFLKYNGIDLVRACFNYKGNNGFLGLFLKEFGASDRMLLDSSNQNGTVTQLLVIMNSPLIKLITDKKSSVMQHKNREEIFLTMMGRPATLFEKSNMSNKHPDELVWILLNSNEFLFKH